MIPLDRSTTALVLIDLQRGVLANPLAPYSAEQVLGSAALLTSAFRSAHALVVLVRVAFSEDGKDRLDLPVDVPYRPGPVPDDWSVLHPSLGQSASDLIVTKRQWSAFYGTELDLQLRRRGITTIVLGGVATNFGVESTARDAWQSNYSVVVVEDACSSLGPELHGFAMTKIFPRIARIRKASEVVTGLK